MTQFSRGFIGILLTVYFITQSFASSVEQNPPVPQNTDSALISPQKLRFLSLKFPEINAIFSKVRYKKSIWGLRVVDSNTGELLVDLNSDKLFYIGSVRKIFTIGEFLSQLGANYQFKTPVSYQGTLKNGLLQGNLILQASGDLTMGGRTKPDNTIAYSDFDHNEANSLGTAILTSPDPLAGYHSLAKKIHDFGIREIKGEVIIDDGLFPPFNFHDQFKVSAIFVNDDVIDMSITPSLPGSLANVNSRPQSAAFSVKSTLTTSNPHTEASFKLDPAFPACIGKTTCNGYVSGSLPSDYLPPFSKKLPLVQTFRIVEPANYARTVFIEALIKAGIKVNSKAVAINPAVTSEKRVPITELLSLPFSEYAKYILKVSYNIGSDTVFLLYGLTQGVNSIPDTLAIEKKLLSKQYGIPENQFYFVDGSGGGESKATTLAVVKWLQILRKFPDFQAFLNALPILGVDGTLALASNFKSKPLLIGATGKVWAKTGTYGVGTMLKGQAIAGYILAKSGRSLSYHLVVNEVPIAAIEDIAEVLQDQATISAILWREF
ncbi:MAG: D-alanyl-D-alanine carboxypeptidase/D-alanyl-D-alanine-endopeptidase [Tatlockia sp.]|nr:D-alanyl-D-alanine carboxypeptidase/D-alanyl-D-alanine-endopeptidase [Tatlockia sp.]